MAIKNITLADVEGLTAEALESEEAAFVMDEEAFRAFYERTARPLWMYLSRMSGDAQQADDLLQETYYRFLRSESRCDGDAHRRAYLFRIATNLVRDRHRRRKHRHGFELPVTDESALPSSEEDPAARSVRRTDLRRALAQLRPRDRALLWLAYAQGHAHTEIARMLGLQPGSIKLLLFRARRKLAVLLRTPQGGDTRGAR